MDNVNKTLYIPLYGKAFVSRKNIILKDKKAEEIWEKEKFPLKRKSKSKWLAYYMGMLPRMCSDCFRIMSRCSVSSMRMASARSNNALKEELDNSTVANFATVQNEGGRDVERNIEYYNLDI